MSLTVTNFNVLVIGSPRAGKSTWIRRAMTGEFTKRYTPTPKGNVVQFARHTTRGIVQFIVRETSEPEKEDYYGVDGVIVMIDVTDANSMDTVPRYLNSIPQLLLRNTVFVAQKVEARDRPILAPQCVRFLKRYPDVRYCEVSSNSNYHLYKPLDLLLQPNSTEPYIIVQPAVAPPMAEV